MKYEDKWNHFTGCFTAYTLLYLIVRMFFGADTSLFFAGATVLAGGIIVELVQNETALESFYDMLANATGALSAALVAHLFMI